jgi:sec-independent protein translocase protein TatA
MFGLGVPELVLILVIILVLFGAKNLPDIGKALGKTITEFRNATGPEPDKTDAAKKEIPAADKTDESKK